MGDIYTPQNPKLGLSRVTIAGIAITIAILTLGIVGIGFYASKQKKRTDKVIEMYKPFASWEVSNRDGG